MRARSENTTSPLRRVYKQAGRPISADFNDSHSHMSKRARQEEIIEISRPGKLLALEAPPQIAYPADVEFTDAPPLVTEGVQRTKTGAIRRRNIRSLILAQVRERRRSLKRQLSQCEKDCKSLCNKKTTKRKKTWKKNAKKGKK